MALRFKRSGVLICTLIHLFLCVGAHSDGVVEQSRYDGANISTCYGDNKVRVQPLCTQAHTYPLKKLNKAVLVEELGECIQAIPQEHTDWHNALCARKQALRDLSYDCTVCDYVLSPQAQQLCCTLTIGELAYTRACEGNSIDIALHQEARAILEHAAWMVSHPHLMHMHWLAQSIAQVNDAGLYYAKCRTYQAAFNCFDFCWSALSTVPALVAGAIDGARDGALATASLLAHPLDTLQDFAQGIAALSWYTARLLLHVATFHEPLMASIRVQQLTDAAVFLYAVAENIYRESMKLSAYSAARMVSATLVEQIATAKLLRAISFFMHGAAKHTDFVRHMPRAQQASPALSCMPHAYEQAAAEGIEYGLSYLDWAGNDPRSAAKKLRGYISKSHYVQRCERVKAKALPALIETACEIKLNACADAIVHIIWGDLHMQKLGGCHTMSGLKLNRFEQKFFQSLPGGAYEMQIKIGGKWINKSIFPDEISPAQVLKVIREALDNFLLKGAAEGDRYRIVGKTSGGMMVECIFEADGSLVTAFPIGEERLRMLKRK
jgi:predicted nucleic acid-binding protein